MESNIDKKSLWRMAEVLFETFVKSFGKTSCHEFLPKQFRVMLSAAAYVPMDHIRRVALAGTELEKAQVTTIRLKLFKIGARITSSVRRIVLQLSSGWPWHAVFRQAAARLMAAV